jgi:hypothetical protein
VLITRTKIAAASCALHPIPVSAEEHVDVMARKRVWHESQLDDTSAQLLYSLCRNKGPRQDRALTDCASGSKQLCCKCGSCPG